MPDSVETYRKALTKQMCVRMRVREGPCVCPSVRQEQRTTVGSLVDESTRQGMAGAGTKYVLRIRMRLTLEERGVFD